MNRHIIIFTAVTIFYLPLGFVTAVYNMSFMGDEAHSHLKGPYIGSMLVVAGLTYLISIAIVFSVDREKVMPWLWERLPTDRPLFQRVCEMLKIKPPEPNPMRPPWRQPAKSPPPRDKKATGWSNLWPRGGLGLDALVRRRRRGKVGGQDSAPAGGVGMQPVQPVPHGV